MTAFFPHLRAANNVALDGPPADNALGNVWNEIRQSFHFDSRSLVIMIAGISGGRGQRIDNELLPLVRAHIAMSLGRGNQSIPVRAVPGRRAVAFDFFEPVSETVYAQRGGRWPTSWVIRSGLWRRIRGRSWAILCSGIDARRVGQSHQRVGRPSRPARPPGAPIVNRFSAAAIKWNWHRARKAAFVGGPIAGAAGTLTIPVLQSGGFQFAVGDPVFLRQRKWRTVIGRAPVTSTELRVAAVNPSGNSVTVTGATGTEPSVFSDGSVLYAPVPDPSVPGRFLSIISPKIAKFINDNNRPLGAWPCNTADEIRLNGDPVVPEFDGYDGFWSHKNDIRAIGLYNGGVRRGAASSIRPADA